MSSIPDERLSLVFTCCHPALATDAQIALTLREVGGPADARDRARLPRPGGDACAAPRAREAEDPRRRNPVPRAARPPAARAAARRSSRCSTSSSTRATPPRRATRSSDGELCDEAIRLAKLLAVLMPDEAEALGLLALMLLQDSRRDARTGRGWRARAARGSGSCALEPRPHRRGPARARPGAPAPHAGPVPAAGGDRGALHTRVRETDWEQIAALYARARASDGVARRRAQPRRRGRHGGRAGARPCADATACRSTSTTSTTQRGPISCDGSSASTRRPPRTGGRSSSHERSRSAAFCPSASDALGRR